MTYNNDELKATNKDCFFYDENYQENCSACKICNCSNCKFFKPKDDRHQIIMHKDYLDLRKVGYYPCGSRK